jgi:hypothetical protein
MPKYSVEDVIDIIKTLTFQEKILLKTKLSEVLDAEAGLTSNPQPKTQQSQSFGNITIGSGGTSNIDQIAAEGGVNLDRSTTHLQGFQNNIQEALNLLQTLKQNINNSEKFNKIEKKNLESTIEVVEEELDQQKPDKDLIDRAIEALSKKLEGIEKLAQPLLKLTKLIAPFLV